MSLLLRGLKGIRGRGEGGAHNPFQSDRPRKTHPVSFNLKECRFFCSFFLFRLVALISYHDMKPSTVHNCPTTSFYLIHYFEPTNGLHEKGRRGKNPKQPDNGRPPAFQDLPSDKWAFALYHCSIFPWPCFVSFSTKFKSISSLCCKISRHLEN